MRDKAKYIDGGFIESGNLREKTLIYMKQYYSKRGCMPSFAEIKDEFSISKSTVHKIINQLEEDNRIKVWRDEKGNAMSRAMYIRGMKVRFTK